MTRPVGSSLWFKTTMTEIIHTIESPYMTRSTRRIEAVRCGDQMIVRVRITTPGWDDVAGGATLEEIEQALSEAKAKLSDITLNVQVICPDCDGHGESFGISCGPRGCSTGPHKCTPCAGVGWIDEDEFKRILEGERIRRDRIARRVTLREEAGRLGMTAIEYSYLEQDKVRS